ncbi:MAG TPA: hypothetical protein PKI19_01485 [Elusimicrobiales bacterium]|nr:hypothetical protein [Elusimicrobiales bacterium]
MNSPEEGELVESGTFRVDTRRMLEVLSRYQLQSPYLFLRAWTRCAVASGASEVRLKLAAGAAGAGFEFAFDGRLFTNEELSDVYAPLLAGGQGRGRHLAAGLLAILKTDPGLVSISSGQEAVTVAGTPEAAAAPAAGNRTVLRVLWAKEPAELPLGRIFRYPLESAAALACCPIAVHAPGGDSKPFKEIKPPAGALSFEEGRRRGFIAPAFGDGSAPVADQVPPANSETGIHVLGGFAETFALRMPLAPVSADINDDDLALDASFSKCVRDERFVAALAFLDKQAETLIFHEIREQKRDLDIVGSLVKNPGHLRLWRARMEYLKDWETASVPGWRDYLSGFLLGLVSAAFTGTSVAKYLPEPKDPETFSRISRTGPRTWWLQDACRRTLKGRSAAPGEPVLHALWRAPVLLSTKGAALSLSAVHKRAQDGRLAVSRAFEGESFFEEEAVWLSSFRDEAFLNDWIPRGRWYEKSP